MSKAIGIDLGTTNSAAAIKTVDTRIIANAEGEDLTPSVVSMQRKKKLFGHKKEFLVGRHALDWMQQEPANTVVSIKRLMGRGFQEPDVQRMLDEGRYNYKIAPLAGGSEQSVAIVLDGEEYTPEQISAKILDKIHKDCMADLKDGVEYAVVTVPAYFNDKQKHATRAAAALAGLKVQRLLPEPTAAAISFGVDELDSGEGLTVLVFDLGGGTFDLAVLTIADGQFIEQAKGGDMWMGGDDIDNLLLRDVYRETAEENDIDDIQPLIDALPEVEKSRFLGDIKARVEEAKIRLSTHTSAVVEILGVLKDKDGDIVDIEVEIGRERLESLLKPFVDRAMELIRKVLEGIHFEPDLVDRVILVGGSSSIPLVARAVRELFGEEKVLLHDRPMLAIAEGAAILAHRLADDYECPACGKTVQQGDAVCPSCGFDLRANLAKKGIVDIVHTTSHDYYLALEGGEGYRLAESNTPLPFQARHSFSLVDPEQRLVHLQFHNAVNEKQESIGDLWLSFSLDEEDVESAQDSEEPPAVLLDFEIDVDNLITVSAQIQGRPDIRVSRTLSRGKADERLFIELREAIDRVNKEEHKYYTVHDFLDRAVGVADMINRVVDPETDEEDRALARQIEERNQVARELLDQEESPWSNLYYAKDFLNQMGQFMSPEDREALSKEIEEFQKQNETGSAQEILHAREQLFAEMDKYTVLQMFVTLRNAHETCLERDPARAPYFEKYIRDITLALQRGDASTIAPLLIQVMPEVHKELDWKDSQKFRIEHGVQRS